MPELPDVEGFRSYLEQTSLRRRISRVEVHEAERVLKDISATTMRRRLTDHQLTGAHRHGKFLFASLDDAAESSGNTAWLVMHFGMSGGLQYDQDGPLPEHVRLVLHFKGGGRLAYQNQRKLGQLTVTDELETFIAKKAPGRDALDDAFTKNAFHDLLADRRGMVKAALVNQDLIAGIGNVYADEILFQAGVRPDAKVNRLDDKHIESLYKAMRNVMSTAARVAGDISRLPETYLMPHRQKGEPCPKCDDYVASMKTSGRTSYYCPACQQ